MADFTVTLLSYTNDPQTISVAGALGCFEEKSSAEIFAELMALPEAERLKKERAVLRNSFGRGHGSVGDQNCFIFSVEDLPRLATFQLCLPQYLEHLQQSLRRAKASRGFFLPQSVKDSRLGQIAKDRMAEAFTLYEKMSTAGIPDEDARYILPLCAKTNIQTGGNARELCHLLKMSRGPLVPSIVREVVKEMVRLAAEKAPSLFADYGFNFKTVAWAPAAQLFYKTNHTISDRVEWEMRFGSRNSDALINLSGPQGISIAPEAIRKAVLEENEAELANLQHFHFEFIVPMSLACLHQAIRQRTWNHSVETLYDAVRSALKSSGGRFVKPASIRRSIFTDEYDLLGVRMLYLYEDLVKERISDAEALGVIPHLLKIYDWVHINGWNAIHSMGKRTCQEAQWEIRFIAQRIAATISEMVPAFREWAEPQCVTLGSCPETRDCGYYKKKK